MGNKKVFQVLICQKKNDVVSLFLVCFGMQYKWGGGQGSHAFMF